MRERGGSPGLFITVCRRPDAGLTQEPFKVINLEQEGPHSNRTAVVQRLSAPQSGSLGTAGCFLFLFAFLQSAPHQSLHSHFSCVVEEPSCSEAPRRRR